MHRQSWGKTSVCTKDLKQPPSSPNANRARINSLCRQGACIGALQCQSMSPSEELLRPRDAAVVLGISYPSLKQWIYKGKLRTVKTAGGHHRIPQSEIDRFLFRSLGKQPAEKRANFRNISGRNQLVGRIV